MDLSTLLDEEEQIEETDTDTSEEDTEDTPGDDAEEVRKNAARKITSQGHDLRKTDLALVDLIAETPEKAPDIIARINGENPKLAQRLTKLYQRREKNNLSAKFKDPQVQEAFEALSAQVETLKGQTEDRERRELERTFRTWKSQTPELEDTALKASFKSVMETRFQGQTVSEDLLDDALAIAKRRIGYVEEPVRKQADRIVVEQARLRTGTAPRGGRAISTTASMQADLQVAQMFGNADPERLKKVAEAKAKGRF